MRKLMLVLASFSLATPALAEDTKGIRLKMSQDFFTRQADWQIVADEAGDKVYTDTMSFLNGGSRFEVTKLIVRGLSLGASPLHPSNRRPKKETASCVGLRHRLDGGLQLQDQ